MATVDVKVPAPITVKFGDQERVIAFWDFLKDTLLADPSFGKTWDDIISAVTIREALEKLQSDHAVQILEMADGKAVDPLVLHLDEREFERLYKVAKEPQAGYNPLVVVQLVNFLRAIKNARNP